MCIDEYRKELTVCQEETQLVSFMIMVVAIVYFIKSNPTPIINHHYSTIEVIEPPKKVIMEEEICTRIDGCPIVNGVCETCQIVKG